MSDLWFEASADHDLEAREAALAQAEGAMVPIWPFLFQSVSEREFEHRLAFAGDRLERIAGACGLPPGELEDTARRRYALLKEALEEGVDPVAPVLQAGQSFGSGPAQGYGHDEGPDFSHGYSEIPQGPPGGPDLAVTGVPEPAMAAPQQQATASLCRCGSRLTRKARCKACRHPAAKCMCRTAQGLATMTGPAMSGPAPTISGGGGGLGGGTAMTPVQMGTGPARGGAGMPGAQSGAGAQGYDLTPDQDVTAARRDPVRRQVEAIAASVAASNPQLPASECRRVARRVVGGYLRRADLASSVMSDEPWAGSSGSAGSGSGGSGDGGGGFLQHHLEWKGLQSMMPGGGGGGAAAGAGEAAGGLADVAELAAL